MLTAVRWPLLETRNDWVVHGFSYPHYLTQLGPDAQHEIYKKSAVDLAMRDAFCKIRDFLMQSCQLSEDEAISLISIAIDFGVTQVVDGNWGVHARLRKSISAAAES
jgi:acetamidase/formamidase